MSFSREIKDFTEGFTSGYKIYGDIATRAETEKYHEELYKHWLKQDAASGNKKSEDDKAAAAGDAAKAALDPNKKLDGSTDTGGGTGTGGNKPTLTPEILNDPNQLLKFIRDADGGGDYGATVYNQDKTPGEHVDFQNMTVSQVLAYQNDMVKNGHASTALGGYQFTAPTLRGLIKTLGIDPNTKFTNDLQDQLATELLRQHGYDDWKAGKAGMTTDKLLTGLSREWASLPDPRTGVSRYEGDAVGNHATVGFAKGLVNTVPSGSPAAYGGGTESSRRLGLSQQPAVPATATAGNAPPAPAIPPPPAVKPSIATPQQPAPTQTGATTPRPQADLGTSQNPIPVPPSMQAQALPPDNPSPVQLASATSPWAIPGNPNPMATQTFAVGGLVEQGPPKGYVPARYDSGTQVAESAIPPHAANTYAQGGVVTPYNEKIRAAMPIYGGGRTPPPPAETDFQNDRGMSAGDLGSREEYTDLNLRDRGPRGETPRLAQGGSVQATQLQAHIPNPLPGYQAGGSVEPEEEDTEGDTSPVPGFDPNTPVSVAGYTGKFTAAQAQAAKDEDEDTPGIDEYWAAVRRQQASLPAHGSAELTASRPPGQAIPTTGTTPPGQPDQPTNPIDWLVNAIKNIPEAVHGGLIGLTQMLGLNAGIPSGAPTDPATAKKLATGDGITLSPGELKQVDQKVDPDSKLTPGLRNIARLNGMYTYYIQQGDTTKANKMAGAMIATIEQTMRIKGAQAELAGKNGDYAMLANKLQEAHDEGNLQGSTMKTSNVSKDGADYEIFGPDGKVSAKGRATIDDMMQLAANIKNGTRWFQDLGYLGGTSTPAQIAKDRNDAAVSEYMSSPGPMNAGQAQWLANKSPEQRAAIEKMDWKTKDQLFRTETTEQKQTQDQQNQQEAARLTGLVQDAYQRYQDERSQRTDPDQPTNTENAARTNLEATIKAAQDWASGAPGRLQYMQKMGVGLTSPGKLNVLPGEGGAGLAIPSMGGASPRAGSKADLAAQAATQQRLANKAERIGVLSQQQFDENGKPLNNAQVQEKYQRVLNLQAAQKAYDEAGIQGSPKQKDLQEIDKEITDQIPTLNAPGLEPVKQRTNSVASVIMNANDVTAHDAVGMVKAATQTDKDGNPSVPMGLTKDGRLRIGDYEPMIVSRSMMGMLADLQQRHAQVKPPPKVQGDIGPAPAPEDLADIPGALPQGATTPYRRPPGIWENMRGQFERERAAAQAGRQQAIPGP